jgi:hypothetical protein
MYKVRFHLARGEHYRKWQVKDINGNTVYYEPSEVSLTLFKTKLNNRKVTAQKIFDGATKSVCAWVSCERVIVSDNMGIMELSDNTQVRYNPRVSPNWEWCGHDMDNRTFDKLVTEGRNIYVLV